VIKAEHQGDPELADEVYSSVPARRFGRRQEIEVGHYSGRSNVIRWLEERGLAAGDEVVARVLAHAKQQDHTLTEAELLALVRG
jgi:2-isopropylmalate synthase